MEKLCTKCNTIKIKSEFCLSKNNRLCSHCKACRKIYADAYRLKNKQKIYEINKSYVSRNREEVQRKQRLCAKKWREKNKDKLLEKAKRYRNRKNELARTRNSKNREVVRAKNREYAKRYKNKKFEYQKNRRLISVFERVKCNLRRRTQLAFKVNFWKKDMGTEALLGCGHKIAFDHLENQFTEGMSWENHGVHGWHIDHKIPLASAKTEQELIELCHYTNLQPLWKVDNLSKGTKIGWIKI